MRRFGVALLLLLASTAVYAANDLPPGYKWRTITTPHFAIHFHQGEEELARRTAAYAESAYQRVTPMLGWEPSGRTHLVLTDHIDASNGSANPFPYNQIQVWVTAPGADPGSPIANYDNWLNLVVTHEYTHIVHLDQARGFDRFMRKVLGRNVFVAFPELWSPPWFIEGLATLSESENTAAGRLKGTYVDMVLRTAAAENRWDSPSQATGEGPSWPDGGARYYYGSRFLEWLATTRGMDKLRAFVHDYSSNIVPYRMNASAEDVYGTSMSALWRTWSEEQQRAYQADVQRLAADGITARQRLTNLGHETGYPVLSPDGSRLAYAHIGPFERATIRVRDVAAGRDVATHAVNSIGAMSWSPDGRSIAYATLDVVGSFEVRSDLYLWTVGGGTRRLTTGARLRDPAFTADGRTLIAVENGEGRNRLVEVDAASGAIRALVTPDDDRQFSQPVVSHDGSRIAVAEWRSGAVDVVVYDRTGQRLANLTSSLPNAINASPRFSSDDGTVWFSSDATGVTNLYAVPAAGGAVRRLTNVTGGTLYPTSADGRRFYYADYSSKGFDIAAFDTTRDYPMTLRSVPSTVAGNAVPPSLAIPAADSSSPVSNYSPWSSLRPRWWLPFITSSTVNDQTKAMVGFSTSGFDALQRHAYELTVSNRLYSVLYSYDRFYPTFSVAASRYDEDLVRFQLPDRVATYSATTTRTLAQVAVPWRRAQWSLTGTAGLIRETINGELPAGVGQGDLDRIGVFNGTLQGVRLGAIFGNARQYGYSVSQEHGIVALLDYERDLRSLGSDRSLQQMRADLRGYLTIPYSRSPLGRHVLAVRAAGGRNRGGFILQRELKVGGDEPEPAVLEITHFAVRGFDRGTLRGQTAAIGSVEYRFPLYEIDRGPGITPFFFRRIAGDVFSDAGRAGGDSIASVGAEVAIDLLVGILPVRYRLGVARRLTEPDRGKMQPFVNIGFSF